jgi:hypothetical protein
MIPSSCGENLSEPPSTFPNRCLYLVTRPLKPALSVTRYFFISESTALCTSVSDSSSTGSRLVF